MDSFDAHSLLKVQRQAMKNCRLDALTHRGRDIDRVLYSLRDLLNILLRHEDDVSVAEDDNAQRHLAWTMNSFSD